MKLYRVRDTHGDDFFIEADGWECSGNVLTFYVGEKIVAWFVSWSLWKVCD